MTVLHTKRQFANDASLYKNKLRYLLFTLCSVFPIIYIYGGSYKHIYANKTINKEYILPYFYMLSEYACVGTLHGVCCQAVRKGKQSRCEKILLKLSTSRDGPVKSAETKQQ